MARPRPVPGALHHARADGIQVAVQHHLELVAPAIAGPWGDPRRSITTCPRPPVRRLDHRAKHWLTTFQNALNDGWPMRRPADHVRMGAHQAVTADVDAVPVLVLREKSEEFPPRVVGVEDRGPVVASPEAVMGGSGAYESGAREARHSRGRSKRRAGRAARRLVRDVERSSVRHAPASGTAGCGGSDAPPRGEGSEDDVPQRRGNPVAGLRRLEVVKVVVLPKLRAQPPFEASGGGRRSGSCRTRCTRSRARRRTGRRSEVRPTR